MMEKFQNAMDWTAFSVWIAAFVGWLPHIAAVLSIIWVALRIYLTVLEIREKQRSLADDD